MHCVQVRILLQGENGKLRGALVGNLKSAVTASFLMLPESFSEEELFLQIAGLSYCGEWMAASEWVVPVYLTLSFSSTSMSCSFPADLSKPFLAAQASHILHNTFYHLQSYAFGLIITSITMVSLVCLDTLPNMHSCFPPPHLKLLAC